MSTLYTPKPAILYLMCTLRFVVSPAPPRQITSMSLADLAAEPLPGGGGKQGGLSQVTKR